MAGISEEEFQTFVNENKDLIERMIQLQKGVAVETLSVGREFAHETKDLAEESAAKAKQKADEALGAAYNMFMDPDVQRHFMTMGMEFFMGMATMMQKAPLPDFVKNAASDSEKNMKDVACRANTDCSAKKATKVDIRADKAETPKNVPQNIIITDSSDGE